MIEKLHRYRGLLVFGLILVAAAFVFGDFSSGRRNSAGGSRAILGIAGKTYDDRDFQKLGAGPANLAQMMLRMGDFGPYQFVFELAKGASSESDLAEKFLVGRVILRNAKEEYGIFPDAAEVSAHIRTMRAFAKDGSGFDEKKYREFIDKDIGRLGLTENDLLDLAEDILAAGKLKAILASGIVADRETIAKSEALQKQQITANLGRLELAPFQDKIQPTEEEIKGYWEPIKDAFVTTARRKFSYILVTPVLPEVAAEPEEKESIADVAATDEAKAAAKKKKDEEKALKAAKAAEERRAAQLKTDSLVDDFMFNLEEQKGVGFEELAKANQWEIKTTDLFTATEPPPELNLTERPASTGGKAVDALFNRIRETSDPVSKFSKAIPVGENQWLIARLDGEEKAREMTFAEARADARAKFIAEKAAADLKAAAETALTKIKEAIAGGKSFADAAKDAGVTETKAVTAITSAYKPDGATEPPKLFDAASKVDPGGFADVLIESDRAFILHVVKREVVKDPNAATALDSAVTMANNQNETLMFDAWLAARVEAAKVDQIYKRAK